MGVRISFQPLCIWQNLDSSKCLKLDFVSWTTLTLIFVLSLNIRLELLSRIPSPRTSDFVSIPIQPANSASPLRLLTHSSMLFFFTIQDFRIKSPPAIWNYVPSSPERDRSTICGVPHGEGRMLCCVSSVNLGDVHRDRAR